MLSLNKTVREIALEQPQATRVFEKLKIDYCCGGNKGLLEACVSAGVEVANVERMLEAAARAEIPVNGSLDFQNATLSELIDYILEKHHVFTKEEMVRLEALTAKVIAAHGENHPELKSIGVLFDEICLDLKPHMFKEEEVLFPYIIEMERSILEDRSMPVAPFGTVNNPVRKMVMEHDTVGDLLRQLRASSSDYSVPADGCISYKTLYQALAAFELDLHQHIHLENNILFPRAIEMEASFK
jgi:regulator of cell morphogenesis and NO signaling